jgi:diaminohydroxyphosphoribosylaminopyrimidine deaminase / 5-amino-6-(5-phosphoribosylamino)uracil reductase
MTPDETYMLRALDLARKGEGRTCPNPPVGAVIVSGETVIGEGYHPAAGEPHAEIHALRAAGGAAKGATLYVTLEPCAHHGRTGPCVEALIEAGVKRVVAGIQDPNPQVAGRGFAQLRDKGIEVQVGVREAESRRLIAPFAKHLTTGLPFVTLKAALTLDGKTATSLGESQWISCEASRELVHQFRNRVDGIMAGIGTVLRDNPRLTTRISGDSRDPVRVIVDSTLRTPLQSAVIATDSAAATLIATTPQASKEQIRELERAGAEILICNEQEGSGVDLHDLMRQLGKYPLQHILLEGGGILNQSLLAAGLIDRVMLFVAPLLMGGSDGKGLFSGHGPQHLTGTIQLTDLRVTEISGDLLIEGEVARCLPA